MQRSPLGRHSPALQEDEDAIRRRKLAAERRVQERHRALLFEQRQKTKTTAEERQRLMAEMREREAKEMKRRQEELHRHLEWLERDKARKKEILSRQHAVTSRVANKPGTGFGSSTPRDLSYLNNLSKEQKMYDKKLSPPSEPRPAFKANVTPTKQSPNMMTTSMYVPSSTPRRLPQPKQAQKAPKTANLMTQSFYTPSRAAATPVSAPRPKPRTAPPVAKAKLPPASPSKPKKAPTPVKQVIIEETPIVEPIKIVESAVVTVQPPTGETEVEKEELLVVESSFLEEPDIKTVISSEERVEETKAVEEKQPEPVEEETVIVVENEPELDQHEIREDSKEDLEKEAETQNNKVDKKEEPEMEASELAKTEEIEKLIDYQQETETTTSLFDELAALNLNAPMPNNEVMGLDYSHDPIVEKEIDEISHKTTVVDREEHKIIELNGHHMEDFENFLLPGAVPEREPAVKEFVTTLADELSAVISNGEKPESIELNTSRPPSPPVAPKNDDLDEIQRRREEDQKHNDEIKARFAAVKARIGRVSPPNVNGNGLPPPAPAVAAPVAPADNGKPLSDSTAALLSRLTKMGALKSTKAAESVESLLTRHASDPKIEQAMTSIVKLEALSGVKDDGPLCYLLQIDESYVLLDCGWDDTFDLGYVEAVKERVPQINAVLLTYPDIAHLGALPYLVTKCGLNCPVYATVPVFKMGQMFMYDWVNGHLAVEDFDVFSLDDVDAAFERVQQVKYNQTILMKGDNGIQFTPLAAGHMIGGAIWKISKQGDEEIIYAVDFNHKKERHLNGALFDSISRPHLLITDAFNATYTQSKRRDRDEELVTKMLMTVKGGGDCLVVIDTAGRILEIAHLLDGLWSNVDAGLGNYNLVMLSHVASTVVDFAKSQVEWMSEKILKSFENGRYNPFAFRNVQLCHSLAELARVRSPKVVLCSGTDMECGFSRELFLEWSSDSRNCIILTCRAGTRTLGSKLISMADPSRNASRQVQIEVKRRIRLEGMELDQYRRKKFEKEQEAARQRLEQSRRNARIGLSQDEEDDDSEDEEALANAVAAVTGIKPAGMVPATPVSVANAGRRQSQQVPPTPSTPANQQLSAAVQAASQLALDNPYDLMLKFEYHQKSAFFKQTKKTYPMFPFIEEKVKWDDYGEIIRPEEYITNESIVPEANTDNDGDGMKMEVNGIKKESKPSQTIEEWPTKCIAYHQKLEVLCKLEYIDFEGRSDGESIKKILAQIKPKQLIIVHGSKEATHHLAQHARDNGIVQGKIFTPSLGLVIDATVESHIYQVMLSDAVMTQMMFQPVKEAELSWIDARIVHREPEDEEMDIQEDAEMMEVDEEGNPVESMVPKRLKQKKRQNVYHLEALSQTSIPSHQAVFVNDPKLSDLKQILVSAGYQAEFSSGVLFINGIASIKRNEAGKFHVEGCAGVDYYKIRDVIYNQFAII